MLHVPPTGRGGKQRDGRPREDSLGARKGVRPRVTSTLKAGEDTCIDVGLRGVRRDVHDLQPVSVVASKVLQLCPHQAPEVCVLVGVAQAVGGPPLHAVHDLRVVHMDGDAADKEGEGHVECVDLAGGAVEIVVGNPALVGDLDAVVNRVDLYHRPPARGVAGLLGADQRPVGEDMASEGACAVGAPRGPREGRPVGAAGPGRQPGEGEKASAVERVVLSIRAASLDVEIEGLDPPGARSGQS